MAFCVMKKEDGKCLCDGKICRFRVMRCAAKDMWKGIKALFRRQSFMCLIVFAICGGLIWAGVARVDRALRLSSGQAQERVRIAVNH